jgi:DNA-binding MarR family transcriptional regulator
MSGTRKLGLAGGGTGGADDAAAARPPVAAAGSSVAVAGTPADPADAAPGDLPGLLRELAWIIHRTAPERTGGPIPTTAVALLKQVMDAPGSTVGDLTAALGLRQPNVSAAVRVLEQRGFVRRVKSEGDRRETRIVPTDVGAAEYEALSEEWKAPVQGALDALEAGDRAALEAAAPALQRLYGRLAGGR